MFNIEIEPKMFLDDSTEVYIGERIKVIMKDGVTHEGLLYDFTETIIDLYLDQETFGVMVEDIEDIELA